MREGMDEPEDVGPAKVCSVIRGCVGARRGISTAFGLCRRSRINARSRISFGIRSVHTGPPGASVSPRAAHREPDSIKAEGLLVRLPQSDVPGAATDHYGC